MDNENKTTGEQNGENGIEITQNQAEQIGNTEQTNNTEQTSNIDSSDSLVNEAQPKYSRQNFGKYPVLDGRLYTYDDYIKWDTPEYEKWELFDGVPVLMATPAMPHNLVVSSMLIILGSYLRGKKCNIFSSNLAVNIDNKTTKNNVFIPDLVIVCDRGKFDEKACIGAPDLVIEVLSPSTEKRDKTIKFEKFEQEGVPEYWIIDPKKKLVLVYILTNGKYIVHLYTEKDTVKVHVLDDCAVDLTEVFE